MTSDKKSAALLTEILVLKGLQYIVISPGSRNAPIILSFADNPDIKAISIVDERSAAFFALGIAQQTKKPVAIACTSGTAALNYAPAIAEAYYQKVPLLVLTADRPADLIDQGDGQTIRQKNLYKNYIKGSFEIAEDFKNDKEFDSAVKTINKAINLVSFPDYGPVHINLPFSEPIYNSIKTHNWKARSIRPNIRLFDLKEDEVKRFARSWNKYTKKLLIAGMMDPNIVVSRLISRIVNDPSVVLLTESTSNLNGCNSINGIDKVVSTILPDEIEEFKPELLVTFGGNVVSKMVKEFLRKNKPVEHWHIDTVDYKMNTYQCLTSGIQTEHYVFFNEIIDHVKQPKSNYKKVWQARENRSEARHKKYLKKCGYSDLKIFEAIFESIPDKNQVQLGNSTPVRYAQLFKVQKNFTWFSNRGVSGIDGAVSTAAGACYGSLVPTTLIVGDLGFLYDSNALMNNYLSHNFRIIIINNGGGGIFRIIPGPEETGHLLRFFDARHEWNAKYIAKNFRIPYFAAGTMKELKSVLRHFFEPGAFSRPAILEVFTPAGQNGEVLKSYFKYLRD